MEYLLIRDNITRQEYEYPLERDFVIVGGSADCSISLEGTAPSHLRIERYEDGFKAVDLHTEDGTQINNEWIIQKKLSHGDKICLGPHIIYFVDHESKSMKPDPRPFEKTKQTTAAARRPMQPAERSSGGNGRRSNGALQENGAAQKNRARRRSIGAGPLLGLLVIVVAVGGAWYAFKNIKKEKEQAPSEMALFESAFEKARDNEEKGHYGAARQLLEAVRTDTADPDVLDRVRLELDELDRAETRGKRARQEIEEIAGNVRSIKLGDSEDALSRFEAQYGELAFLTDRVEEVRADLKKIRTIQEEEGELLGNEEVKALSDKYLEKKDYSTALKVWNRFLPRQLDDQRLKQRQLDIIQSRAVGEARRLISQADELVRDRKLAEAQALFGPADLARFKGTAFHERLMRKALDLETEAGHAPGPLRPSDLSSKEKTGNEGTGGAPDRGQFPSQTGTGRRAGSDRGGAAASKPGTGSVTSISPSDFEEVDDAVRSWEYDHAVSVLQRLLKEAQSAEDKKAVSVRTEFVYRQLWFLENIEMLLGDDPERASRIRVKTRDGSFTGHAHSMVNSMLNLASADDIQGFLLEKIEPRSLCSLALAYSLSLEEKLNLAFFCLNNNLRKEFDVLAAEIRKEGTYSRSIDSVLAMGKPGSPEKKVAVEFGSHLLAGRMVTHVEWREAILAKEVAALKRKIVLDDPAVRNQGYLGFLDLGPVSYDTLEQSLRQRYAKQGEKLLGFAEMKKLDKLSEVKEELNRRRDHALELIFDTVKYFYPYRDRQGEYWKVQQDVDRRVEAVREMWGNEFDEAVRGSRIKLSPQFIAIRDDLVQMARILDDVTDGSFKPEGNMGFAALLPAQGREVNLRNFALNADERRIIDTSIVILAMNEKAESAADNGERQQVRITNLYRMMMGRQALALNELIFEAAEGHSLWMSRSGTFSHYEDTDERRTPTDRMALAGYERGSGENIYRGGGGPMGAHNGWIHSSGHHRNLLFPSHTEMATGAVGTFWTQNFGGGSVFNENVEADR